MQTDPNQKITIIGLIIAILIGSGYYFFQHQIVQPQKEESLSSHQESPSLEAKAKDVKSSVIVSISGAVRSEGVYKVDSGTRIYNLIKIAGGALPSADYSSINLAEIVRDGMKITIPQIQSQMAINMEGKGVGGNSRGSKIDKKININTASASELDELPGVGPATAQKIIDARSFSKIEDLAKISRFGKSKVDKIRDRICL